jgi:putative RNA 2'-phosphotransferase
MNKEHVKLSRLLSKVLRHAPESIGITLDENGWVEVQELLKRIGKRITLEDLVYIVVNNNKKRFEFSTDQKEIRACQGHSIEVDLELKPVSPPDILYHGTSIKTVEYIKRDGIIKMNRNHVHLSFDYDTAHNVGQRHGKPSILLVDAKKMHEHGMEFFTSTNHVWLTDFVPKEYILNINYV